MYIRLDTIPQRNGRTDRQTDRQTEIHINIVRYTDGHKNTHPAEN